MAEITLYYCSCGNAVTQATIEQYIKAHEDPNRLNFVAEIGVRCNSKICAEKSFGPPEMRRQVVEVP